MNVAFIPVRGGSKSIPLKNIKEIAGKPLVYWAVKAANDCRYIDKVYVATDSEEIRKTVETFQMEKVAVIGRSEETATDTASTESAMLEFASNYPFDNIVLIQATSPLLTVNDLDGGFDLYRQDETDSVLSVVRQKRFCWSADKQGYALPINYDVYHRPRRQEFNGYLVENGAFYITGKEALLTTRNRISGRIRPYEMGDETYFEIDEPADWIIIEEQLKRRLKGANHPYKEIPEIKMFLTDCDGCLTDGGMYYSENGDEMKKFSTLDGMGFQLLRERGILTGIITGEDRGLNRRRAEKLKTDILRMGVHDKAAVVRELSEEYSVPLENIAYVGDDINDLDTVRLVGWGCCVANAVASVKQAAKYVSPVKGGSGAIREIVDYILACEKERPEVEQSAGKPVSEADKTT